MSCNFLTDSTRDKLFHIPWAKKETDSVSTTTTGNLSFKPLENTSVGVMQLLIHRL